MSKVLSTVDAESVSDTNISYKFDDFGPGPDIFGIVQYALLNTNYRSTIWTGPNLQCTLMSIPKGQTVGLEVHPNTDQVLIVVEGEGYGRLGPDKETIAVNVDVSPGYAVFVPAGTWHDVVNTGDGDLRLITFYAPPHHPHGTMESTAEVAEEYEKEGKDS